MLPYDHYAIAKREALARVSRNRGIERRVANSELDHRLRRDQSERAGDERPLHGNSHTMGTPRAALPGRAIWPRSLRI